MSGEVRVEESGRSRWLASKLAHCKLTCDNLCDVCRRQDGMPAVIFFLYRLVLAGYFFAFLIYFTVITVSGIYGVKFLIYLTDWTYMEVTVYFCVAFVNVLIDSIIDYRHPETSEAQKQSHRYRYQLQWLLFNISITVSLIVTLVYWPILRPMLSEADLPPLHVDLSIHLFPSIFCLLDLLVTRVTVRFAHCLYPFLFLLAYGLFTIIYWAAGGTDPYGHPYIYPITDLENNPGIAVATMVGITVAVLLMHALLKLVCYLRIKHIDRRGVSRVGGTEEERSALL